VLLHQLLVSWGPQGFDAFLKRLQRQYGQQALAAAAAAEQHLAGVAEWQPVTAGMFLWVKLKGEHTLHSDAQFHATFVPCSSADIQGMFMQLVGASLLQVVGSASHSAAEPPPHIR
jgi:DNA-binding transcriptional MocR family regulator